MNRLFHNTVTVLIIMGLTSLNVQAAAPTAMLRSNGGVNVNGNAVTPVTTVFSGDRIETAAKSGGNLYLNGSSILLQENTTLTYIGQDFDFACGGGVVKTTTALGAHFGRLAVKPLQKQARYAVGQSATNLKISALEGNLSVFDGRKTIDLIAGKSMDLAYAGCSSDQQTNSTTNDSQQQSPPPPQNPGSLDPQNVGTASNNNVGTIIVLAPAVVGALATAAILAVTGKPISPTIP